MKLKWIYNITNFKFKIINKNLWKKCKNCKNFIFIKKMEKNFFICYKCNFHFYISSKKRIKLMFKKKIFEIYNNILPNDFLNFFDTKHYYSRIAESQMINDLTEALSVFKTKIFDINLVICIFEFKFIGGSIGRVVGNKIFKTFNFCLKHKLPIVCFFSSGGARMQESTTALMQMAKMTSMLNKLKNKNLPYISVLINPCMGGISASIAMLGDINIAEPKALIGFTGPKVIERFFGKNFSKEFQQSEFLFKKGFIDFIINRKEIKLKIYKILKIIIKKK